MRTFTGAFLGTLAALLFVVGIIAFFAWREAQKLGLGEKIKARADEKLEKQAENQAPEGENGVSSPVAVPSPTVDRN